MLELAGGSPPSGIQFLSGRGITCSPLRLTNESCVGPILSAIAALAYFEWMCCVLLPACLCACQEAPCLVIWRCREATKHLFGGCLFFPCITKIF